MRCSHAPSATRTAVERETPGAAPGRRRAPPPDRRTPRSGGPRRRCTGCGRGRARPRLLACGRARPRARAPSSSAAAGSRRRAPRDGVDSANRSSSAPPMPRRTGRSGASAHRASAVTSWRTVARMEHPQDVVGPSREYREPGAKSLHELGRLSNGRRCPLGGPASGETGACESARARAVHHGMTVARREPRSAFWNRIAPPRVADSSRPTRAGLTVWLASRPPRARANANVPRFELRRRKSGRHRRARAAAVYTSTRCAFSNGSRRSAPSSARSASPASSRSSSTGAASGRASRPAIAAGNPAVADRSPAPYDLTQLKVVNEVLKTIRDRYVDPKRVKPKEMLLSALDYVQKDVAQVIVIRDESNPDQVKVRVDTQEKEFRVDNVQGPWDVSSRLRDVFALHAGRPARHRRRPARRRVRGVQRHAAHARPALRAALARRVQGDEPLHAGPVRRPRHRHLDPRPAAHRDEPDAGHARRARGAQEVRPHRRRSTASRRSTWASTRP